MNGEQQGLKAHARCVSVDALKKELAETIDELQRLTLFNDAFEAHLAERERENENLRSLIANAQASHGVGITDPSALTQGRQLATVV
jgi:regulator of replication initiation timing